MVRDRAGVQGVKCGALPLEGEGWVGVLGAGVGTPTPTPPRRGEALAWPETSKKGEAIGPAF